MKAEYELNIWPAKVNCFVEINPENYRDMSPLEIGRAVYTHLRADAEQRLSLVYKEGVIVQAILTALKPQPGVSECNI